MKGKFFLLMSVFCCLFMITSNAESSGSKFESSSNVTTFYEMIIEGQGQISSHHRQTDIKDIETDSDGILDFIWLPAEGCFDYYNIYVATNPKDPFSPINKELKLIATTDQPFFTFLGQAGKIYVLQTATVKIEHFVMVAKKRSMMLDNGYQLEYLEYKLITPAQVGLEWPVTIISFDTTENYYGPRSDPSAPVICLKNGDPKKFPNYKRIP